ncbi:MAG: hypothetical protein CM15mP23_17570 [Cryomorphaceae bacterium]|nr:MAG: hypothetical protein CM15mP23_17570 [Cryomorphaceae bacterium]
MSKYFFFLFFVTFNVFGQNSSLDVIKNTKVYSHLFFTNSDLEFRKVENKGELFTEINVDGFSKSYDIGNPDLPVFSKLIEVPQSGDIYVSIINKSETVIDLTDIGYSDKLMPSQPSISKSEDPSNINFNFNQKVYRTDEYYANELITVERLGKMRERTLARIKISPFSYHPLRHSLKIIDDLEFKVEYSSNLPSQNSAYYSAVYSTNFSKLINADIHSKNDFTSSPIRMIILSDPMFEEELQEFIAWKTRLGFDIIEAYKGDDGVGNTKESMKAFVQSYYDNATAEEPAPTYLLIVGDHEQIPSFQMGNGNWGGHTSDMVYCEFDGNGDYFPEMYYGRFSASSVNQLIPQIEKTLEYEQYTMPDPSYLNEVLMVAGVDQSMAATYGNGQINYGTYYYFNSGHGLTSHTFLYPESGTSSSEQQIIDQISKGVGYGNYTAHCSPEGWAEPAFLVNDVSDLANQNQYGLLIGNCCNSNEFAGVTCLGEALLRTPNKGAVGYIGATNSTYWDEDYYWSVGNGAIQVNPTYEETSQGVYDCSFHENDEDEETWSISQGQILHAGNLAVSESNADDEYYWEIYMLMGDPTVLTYYGVPSLLSINHPEVLPLGSNSVNISSEQHTYVAINQDGVLLDASYTDESGNVTLNFDPLDSMIPIEIVASKQNKQVYIQDVNIMSADEPFVIFSDLMINGISGNSQINAGDSFTVDVQLQNFGMVETGELFMQVSTDNPNVSITSESLSFDGLGASDSLSLVDALSIELIGPLENQENISLVFTISDTLGNVWESIGSFTVNAPDIEFVSHTIDDADGNGFIDFNESAVINVTLANVGALNSLDGIVIASSDFSSLQIIQDSILFSPINEGSDVVISVPVFLDEMAPNAENYQIYILATTQDNYTSDYLVNLNTSNCSLGSFEVQVNLTTDGFPDEISWTLMDVNENVIGNAPLNSLDEETSYEDIFCVNNNSYLTYEIFDGYGDGLLWGGYEIIVCDQVIASGSNYGDGETISFIAGCDQSLTVGCTDPESSNYDENAIIDDGSCEQLGLNEIIERISIYPNPASDNILINYGEAEVTSIKIIDMTGREVLINSLNKQVNKIYINELESGTYFVKFNFTNGNHIVKNLIIL